ncbi:MAG: hypothetical protein Q9169_005977 [Polycauliona sp. 2 TL-2023]
MASSTHTQEGAAADGSSNDMNLGPNKIQWRSRYDSRPVDLKEKASRRTLISDAFTDQFKKNDEVYFNGARGSSGPFKVDEVLGKGRYKLRKQDGEKIKKTYDEGDLSLLPRTIA